MGVSGQAKLEWVLYNGEICPVDDFAGLPLAERPTVLCPACERPVVLRLGEVRVHHAAHRQGNICATTQPETALHLNVKFYLARILKHGGQLFIQQKCSGYCGKTRNLLVASGWDEVALEYPMDPYRLDLALLKDSEPILAIEIVVTHPMEEAKKQYIKLGGVSWIELEAKEEIYSGRRPWTPEIPLQPIVYGVRDVVQQWLCKTCQERRELDRYKEYLHRRSHKPKDPNANTSRNTIRLVDFYFSSGKSFREIFTITQIVNPKGMVTCIWLERGDYKKDRPERIKIIQLPVVAEDLVSLEQEFKSYLKGLKHQHGWVIDSPMGWHPWPEELGRTELIYEHDLFPQRYSWKNGRWVLNPLYKEFAWEEYWVYPKAYARRLKAINKKENPPPIQPINIPAEIEASDYPNSENDTIPIKMMRTYRPPTEPVLPGLVCLICGETTTDYWYDNGHGYCKCRKCAAVGKY